MSETLKKFIAGMSLGAGILLAFGGFMLVRAVAPGVLEQPFFGPQDEDVKPQLDIPCSWTDWEEKRLACRSGSNSNGDQNLCVTMNVRCLGNIITEFGPGQVHVQDSTMNCGSCGVVW